MSKIDITYSPNAEQKLTVEQEVGSDAFEFVFNLNLSSLRMDISTLNVSIRLNDSTEYPVFTREFPDPGVLLKSTDQSRMFSHSVRLPLNRTFTLSILASFNNETSSETVQFSTPRPYKANESWTWSEEDEDWVPPIPKPGLLFYWDEVAYQAGEDPWIPLPAGEY